MGKAIDTRHTMSAVVIKGDKVAARCSCGRWAATALRSDQDGPKRLAEEHMDHRLEEK